MIEQIIGTIIISVTWFIVGYRWNKYKILKEYLRGYDDGAEATRNYFRTYQAGKKNEFNEVLEIIENYKKERDNQDGYSNTDHDGGHRAD